MIRFRSGTSLLNKVVKQFNQAIADLDVAAQQIEEKRQNTLDKIDANTERYDEAKARLHDKHVAIESKLDEQEYALYLASLKAQTVRNNIAALVGADTPAAVEF